MDTNETIKDLKKKDGRAIKNILSLIEKSNYKEENKEYMKCLILDYVVLANIKID